VLYQDEKTVYRQPTQGWLLYPTGRLQPRLKYGAHYNHCMRLVGYLNAVTGAVHWSDCASVTVERLIQSVRQLPRLYPHADCIYLVWDNWLNHSQARLLAALNQLPRVRVLCLPTYAPWLNPIEKLWRWLSQTVLHAHPWHDDFRELRQQVAAALNPLAVGSPHLLRYVGLSPADAQQA